MKRSSYVAWMVLAIAFTGAALASAPSAVAAPIPTAYDPGQIFNDTYNNFTTALNVTTNVSEDKLFYLDCAANDYDYMYVWLPAGQDLAFHVWTQDNISFRFAVALKSPEHFNLVVKEVRPQNGTNIFSVWYNTTTWIDGNYYLAIDGPSCPTPSNYYNVSWSSVATSAVSDVVNSITAATD